MKNNIIMGFFAFIMCISISLCSCGTVYQSEENGTSSAQNQMTEEITTKTTTTTQPKTTTTQKETTTTTQQETTTTTPKTTTTQQETTTETTTTVPETTISETEQTTKTSSTENDIKKSVENGDYSLVTPEFKQVMDGYEAFYDDYIEFMNKYTSGKYDMMNMLGDYLLMLDKLDKWTKKIDEIDESTLTPADSAYYFIVTMRIEKKLIDSF